jgi:hypothetical protein
MESKEKKEKAEKVKKVWAKPSIKAELSIEKTLGNNVLLANDGGVKGT